MSESASLVVGDAVSTTTASAHSLGVVDTGFAILSAFPAAFGYQGLWHRQHTSSITTHSNYSVPQRERPSSGAYKSGAGKAQLTRSHGTELDTLAPRHLADPKAIPRFLVHSEQRPSRTLGLTMDTPPPEYSLTVITPSSSSATTVSVWLTL